MKQAKNMPKYGELTLSYNILFPIFGPMCRIRFSGTFVGAMESKGKKFLRDMLYYV